MNGLSLKTKMSAAVSILVAALLTIPALISLSYFERQFKATISAQQFTLVTAIAGEIDDKILAAQAELTAVAGTITPDIYTDPARARRFIAGRPDTLAMFDNGVVLFSSTGKLIAGSSMDRELLGRDFSYRDYFKKTMAARKPHISAPFFSAHRHRRPIVMFTAPIFNEKGELTAILGGSLNLLKENFLGKISGTRLGERGYLYLYDTSRALIVHPVRERILKRDVPPGANRLFDKAIAGFEGAGETVTSRGLATISSFKRLKTTDWILAANFPRSEAYAPVYRATRYLLIALAGVIIVSILIVWFFMGYLIAPLSTLTSHVRTITGKEGTRAPLSIRRNDEIGVLAEAYNRMLAVVDAQQKALREQKEFSENLLQDCAVPTFVLDNRHRVIIWNQALEELTGVRAAQMIGSDDPWKPFYESKRPVLADLVIDGNLEDAQRHYGVYAQSILIPDGLQAEGWYPGLNGRDRYMFFDAAPIRNNEGKIIAAIETLQDITERKRAEEELQTSEERFRRLVELSPDGIALLVEGKFAFLNPAGMGLLGIYEDEQLLGRPMAELVCPDCRTIFEEQTRYVIESGAPSPWVDECLIRSDGSMLDVEVAGGPFSYLGEPALQVIFRDISERKEAKRRLEQLAHFDSLTGLPNRVLFFDRLNQAVAEAERYGHGMALLFLDLDRFKAINDTLGHDAGDMVLTETAKRLRDCVRTCDTVARMGGDEFTVILGQIEEEKDAAAIAERIVAALSAPFRVGRESVFIGVSIGISVLRHGGCDTDLLLKNADTAMYVVKEKGRNGYMFHGEAEQQAA